MSEAKDFESELNAIRKDVEYMKQHMVDADEIMTEEDYEALLSYRKEKSAGKLTSHDRLKNELA